MIRLVLFHLRSTSNVGNILRTAAAFGVDQVDLVGTTPTPDHPGVIKTALGGQQQPWRWHAGWDEWRATLPTSVRLIALETGGEDMTAVTPAADAALIFGSERWGLPPEILQQCDQVVTIPQLTDATASLNVSNAAAIAAFWWQHQRGSI